jgi:hypothetical protein
MKNLKLEKFKITSLKNPELIRGGDGGGETTATKPGYVCILHCSLRDIVYTS